MPTLRWAVLIGCGFWMACVMAMGCGGSAADDTAAAGEAPVSSAPPSISDTPPPSNTTSNTSTSTTTTVASDDDSKSGGSSTTEDKKGDNKGDNAQPPTPPPPPPSPPSPPPDTDGDGVADTGDNCPAVANANQQDANANKIGDACEADDQDADGDGVKNTDDNCVLVANAKQANTDMDGRGDACDNCPTVVNNNQVDTYNGADGIGDACQWIEPGIVLTNPGGAPAKPLNGVFGLYNAPVGDNATSTGIIAVGDSGFMADNFTMTPVWQEGFFMSFIFGFTGDLIDIWGTSSTDPNTPMLYYVVMKPNTIMETGGNNLSGTGIPAGAVLNTLWGTGGKNIYSAGSCSQENDNPQPCILRSTGENQWVQVFPDANFFTDYGGLYSITTIWGSSADYILAAGSLGQMILFYNGGNWVAVETTLPINANVIRLWGTTADNIYMVEVHPDAGDFYYSIRNSADGGLSWDPIHVQAYTQSSGKYPVDIWGRSATEVYIPMSDGSYLQWDGSMLKEKSFGKNFTPKRIYGDPQGSDITVVGSSNGHGVLLHYGTINDNQ